MKRWMSLSLLAFAVSACGMDAGGSGYRGSAPSAGLSVEGPQEEMGAGTLTAGAWDDNLNFDFFLGYLAETEKRVEHLPLAPRADRVVVQVLDSAGSPLAGAHVAFSQGKLLFETTTAPDGRVLFFPTWEGAEAGKDLLVTATLGTLQEQATIAPGAKTAAVTLATQATPVSAIDIALVIDATGSMGDEMHYLTAELGAIASSLESLFPGLSQRWALVFYRDEGDDFVIRTTPFASAADAVHGLAAQQASGGGDYEEVPELALHAAANLPWRGDAVSRLVFHVADAPAHPQAENRLLAAIRAARTLGLHIYPIAASGADERTEYSMRTEAQLTGGRYLFLTDDSGIGNAHKEPTLPCYFVTKLNAAIRRMIQIELTGKYFEPPSSEIIRTGGDPQDGRCTLTDGQTVFAL